MKKRNHIALLLIILFAGGLVIACCDRVSNKVRHHNHQCPTYTPSGNYAQSDPNTGILVPMHSVNRGLRHAASVYRPKQQSRAVQDNTYTSQGLVQLSSQATHSYGTTAASSGAGISMGSAGGSNSTYTGTSSFAGISAYSALAARRKTTTPILAYVSSYASTASSSTPNSTIRRVAPSYDGGYNGETYTDGDGTTWTWSEEDGWVSSIAVGTTKIENGNVYRWNGSTWVFVSNQLDPTVPLGDIPVLLLLLFLTAYCLKTRTKCAATNV